MLHVVGQVFSESSISVFTIKRTYLALVHMSLNLIVTLYVSIMFVLESYVS